MNEITIQAERSGLSITTPHFTLGCLAMELVVMELRMQEGCSAWGCAVEEGRVKEENAGEAGLDQMAFVWSLGIAWG